MIEIYSFDYDFLIVFHKLTWMELLLMFMFIIENQHKMKLHKCTIHQFENVIELRRIIRGNVGNRWRWPAF